MSGNNVRWAILGTSFISEVMAKAIHASATSQLVAIGSRTVASAQQFAHQFSIPKIYDDYQKLLEDQDIDAVYIGLPNHVHKEWILRSAYAGKHILCEKPLVLTFEEAEEVIAAIDETKVFCMEALMYRFHPFTQKLQELFKQQILGDIKLFQAIYTAPIADLANPVAGGSIRNLGCYPISLIRLLAGSEPIELIATGRLNPKTQADNQASALLTFEHGVMAVVSTADDLEMVWQFDVFGTKGHLKVLSNPWLPETTNNKFLIQLYDDSKSYEVTVEAEKPLYTYQIDTVNNHIMTGGYSKDSDAMSLIDSVANIKILEAWLKQVESRKAPSNTMGDAKVSIPGTMPHYC
ncbi:Gfo/Idh/MocA family oxidoreductase [uncultured Legionella sp.]|uniref:Gfo/Idh/MocA family protein n=1 Tax=uncultured Legionella sp. TaxID=210934 RepID=UPI0026353517|nr:Gfo/Idh/MocA family oxidoreductase [uncultured Legionella sp.]